VSVTYVIVGGSSGLGRALAERFAAAGHALLLISSDSRDTEALAADLALRHGVAVRPVACDLASRALDLAPMDAALASLPPLAGLLLPVGASRDGDQPGQPGESFDAISAINFASPCRIVDHLLARLRQAPDAVVVGFGSIAATRGRTRNAAYAAAKRALQSYFESLRHALAGSGVRVQFYVLGYLDTNLAFAQKTALPRAAPEACAARVYRRRGDDFGTAYHPSYWRPLCAVLRLMPWFVFRRLSF
jgi:NAD(P)-dependent dehydrogenase (short-subunit alcohol dehydrogenase family)